MDTIKKGNDTMKCALELVAISTARAEEIAKERELREQMEQTERRLDTINLCERLSAKLEQLANEGKKPTVCFHMTKEGRELVGTRDYYANRRLSYSPCGKPIDIELLVNWFDKLCFKVSLSNFTYWWYMLGQWEGFTINIEPKPNCLN